MSRDMERLWASSQNATATDDFLKELKMKWDSVALGAPPVPGSVWARRFGSVEVVGNDKES